MQIGSFSYMLKIWNKRTLGGKFVADIKDVGEGSSATLRRITYSDLDNWESRHLIHHPEFGYFLAKQAIYWDVTFCLICHLYADSLTKLLRVCLKIHKCMS
jgi:hypothetical protein